MICWSYWTSELICLVRCLWVLARKLFETLCALESEIMSVAMTVLFEVPTPAAQISCIQRRGEMEEGTMQWSLSLAHAVRPSIRPNAYLALSVLVIDAQCERTLDMAWLLATGAPEINTRLYRIRSPQPELFL